MKINGPINVIRMEGYINNIKKIIYIFMNDNTEFYQYEEDDEFYDEKDAKDLLDNHDVIEGILSEPEKIQDCNDKSAVSLNEYILKNIKKNKTYDFFLDLFFTHDIENIESTYIKNYLYKLQLFFYENTSFNYEKNKINSLIKNLRFHFFNLGYIFYTFLYYPIVFFIFYFNEKLPVDYDYIITFLTFTYTLIKFIINIIKKNEINYEHINIIERNDEKDITTLQELIDYITNDETRKEVLSKINYIFYKLLNKYSNKNVKLLINNFINDNYLNQWKEVSKLFKIFLDNIKSKDFNFNKLFKIKNLLKFIISEFNGLFFLRRFLDKKYITRSISYFDINNAMFIIYFLYSIGFKLTNYAKSNISDPNLYLSKIKTFNYNTNEDLMNIFMSNINCVDMSSFPPNFE